MSGIIFLKSLQYHETVGFYREQLGMELWLKQKSCTVLRHGNMLLGFCMGDTVQDGGVITFFYPGREQVDAVYRKMQSTAKTPPRYNPDYFIYHFYAEDNEGRTLEFQTFEHPITPVLPAEELLMQRRSIRKYKATTVPEELLHRVFDLCRWSPTARNQQGYYYIVIHNHSVLHKIVEHRGPAGLPLLAAPLATAVCASGELSRRVIQDGCIAAYHLLLAAKTYGLGTCWVTDMDNEVVKGLLSVPENDYIACLTPLGYADEDFALPERRSSKDFVRHLN